ncbi:J domain-containing protein [bacterium]|nr:J domain-containing protein [bacterium]
MALSPEAIESLAASILANASGGPHCVFSLTADASRDAFKARYRELAKTLHPDKAKTTTAENAFKVVTEAFRAVTAQGSNGFQSQGTHTNGFNTRDISPGTRSMPFWKVREEDSAKPPRGAGAAPSGEAANENHKSVPRWKDANSNGGWGAQSSYHTGSDTVNITRREEVLESPSEPVPDAHPEFVRLDPDDADVYDDDFDFAAIRGAWFEQGNTGNTVDRKHSHAHTETKPKPTRWEPDAGPSVSAHRWTGDRNTSGSRRPTTNRNYRPEMHFSEIDVVVVDHAPYDEPLEDNHPVFDDIDDTRGTMWASKQTENVPERKREVGGDASGRWGDGGGFQSGQNTSGRNRWSDMHRVPPVARNSGTHNDVSTDFDVTHVGDPSELERAACPEEYGYGKEDNLERETFGEDDENAATIGGQKATKKPVKTKPKRKRKVALDPNTLPRPRLAILDEPRVPHTQRPRKKFNQATLAFG